ncbi:MAG TPA: NADH-quinone oxidoreductase subunit L [Candidatus Acidoferrales bacterium]|nr:NADH-quinone oxidoreductase subunit L [Candidatus Acidoferrales bacterium]
MQTGASGTPLEALGLIPAIPLAAALVNVFWGRQLGRRAAGGIACAAVAGSFLLSAYAAVRVADAGALRDVLFVWLDSGSLKVDVALAVDRLSALMLLVITGIGFLIHVYSVGYMAHDDGVARYFAYLNLFIFFMTLLVMADNLVLLFVGWEGVGLCSFLLIGFWYQENVNAIAGNKAFIVNRIGDFGFLLGVLLLFWEMSGQGIPSLDFSVLERNAHLLAPAKLTLITLLLFAGATGKSAQIPLYVWLPDAMQGPTPVSALIHAATMVTAGVYMTARLHFLFSSAPFTLTLIAWIGALTALVAATIALAQNDIKRVLAYSTVSQLGYMFVAVGVGAFSAAIFHLFTHAFFKACLFLSAGSVIHGLRGEQDMLKMGGLKRYFPVTYWTFLAAALAISGAPLTAGFFSKDLILWQAFASARGSFGLWLVGWITAGLTALYMFRQFFLVFHGEARAPAELRGQIHESPPVMTLPLVVLALGSVVAGWLGAPHYLGGGVWESWLAPVFGARPAAAHEPLSEELWLVALTVAIAALGVWAAYIGCVRSTRGFEVSEPAALRALYRLLARKYYVDEAYDVALVQPLTRFSSWLAASFDPGLIDGAVNAVAGGFWAASVRWRRLQSGYVQHYLFAFLLGALIVLSYFTLG